MDGFTDLNCANFCNVKVSGDTASADIKAAVSYPEIVREIIDSDRCTGQKVYDMDARVLLWKKKMPEKIYTSKEEGAIPRF
jgi:hypothetical protein